MPPIPPGWPGNLRAVAAWPPDKRATGSTGAEAEHLLVRERKQSTYKAGKTVDPVVLPRRLWRSVSSRRTSWRGQESPAFEVGRYNGAAARPVA